VARALMVGISLGGMTALEMAVHHGDRLTGIVACNCRDFVDDAGKAAWEERIGITQKGGMTAIASGTIARWFTDDFRLSNPDLMQRVADMINATQPLGFEACARAIMTMTLQSKIDAISIPAHFVAGSDDGAASSDVMNAMAKRVSGAACTTLADCGHLSSLNRGPELLHEIRTFATHISN
jgi:3-oxoadipate enol-lactonase